MKILLIVLCSLTAGFCIGIYVVKPKEVETIKTEYVAKTPRVIQYTDFKPKSISPVPYWQTVYYDTLTREVDSAAILADFFKERTFVDTLINDSTALAILTEKVAMNNIQFRELFYQPYQKTIATTKYITEKRKVAPYLGFQGNLSGTLGVNAGVNFGNIQAGISLMSVGYREDRFSLVTFNINYTP